MSEPGINLALFGLLGAFVGAVPGILGVLYTWFKNRDAVSRSLRRIELAKSEVEFISTWLEVASSLDDDEALERRRQAARTRLDRLIDLTEEEIERRAVESKEDDVAPKKARGNIWFYVYSGFFFFMMLGASIDDQNNFSIPYLIKEISGEGGVVLLVFGIPWAVLFVRFLLSKRRSA
ncbi:MAG: hypothetical protein GY791_07970 [Alphaproteobacteria bacterium]|nr:hypothetical protein [Alphaproteobacteria bacterium]